MSRPLYHDAAARWPEDFPPDGHAGLWFDRFFDRYDRSWQVPKDESGKLAWIRTVTNGKVGDDAVAIYAARQAELARRLGGDSIRTKTDWHFATGLGRSHPVENGFAWHPTLGVPYLTGAAVKGLLRGWCDVWSNSFERGSTDRRDKLRRWFGPSSETQELGTGRDNSNEAAAAGELIFFDAVPLGPIQLKADVMTPHYGDWYEKGDQAPAADGSNAPADWHSPVPVPFLVVAPGQAFQFSVAARPGSSIDIKKEVMGELALALAGIGAGAKTATGYGLMSLDVPRCAWVDHAVDELMTKNKASEEQTLRGKALAEAWQRISDPQLKALALEDIRRRWEKNGWWNGAGLGKAASRARAIYQGSP